MLGHFIEIHFTERNFINRTFHRRHFIGRTYHRGHFIDTIFQRQRVFVIDKLFVFVQVILSNKSHPVLSTISVTFSSHIIIFALNWLHIINCWFLVSQTDYIFCIPKTLIVSEKIAFMSLLVLSMKSPVYKMSCQWYVVSMKCHIYKCVFCRINRCILARNHLFINRNI